MKRKNFVTLILGTIGGMLFALGMCMGLIAEWNAFIPGVILGVAGVAVLLVMLAVRRKMEGKPPVNLNGRNIARVVYGIVSALVLGTGMCMTTGLGWTDGSRHYSGHSRYRDAYWVVPDH